MKKILLMLIGLCFTAPALGAAPVVEVFGCTLKQGKTIADFDRAAAAWAAQADKLPANRDYFAAILRPYRGMTGYGGTNFDVVWVGSNPSMDAWAKANAAGLASADETAALAGIDATVSCASALYQETTVFDGLKDEPGDVDAVLESYVCSLKPGKTAKDVEAFEAAYVAASKTLKSPSFSAYRWDPLYAPHDIQYVYLVANDDWTTYAAAFAASTTKEWQASNAAAAATFSCDSALWLGHIIHQPPPTPH